MIHGPGGYDEHLYQLERPTVDVSVWHPFAGQQVVVKKHRREALDIAQLLHTQQDHRDRDEPTDRLPCNCAKKADGQSERWPRQKCKSPGCKSSLSNVVHL